MYKILLLGSMDEFVYGHKSKTGLFMPKRNKMQIWVSLKLHQVE